MNILYFGDQAHGSTSRHRAEALRRIGHHVTTCSPLCLVPKLPRCLNWINYRTGYCLIQRFIRLAVRKALQELVQAPDLIWVDSGELFGSPLLSLFKSTFKAPILLFNVDDPTSSRDWFRFASLRTALPFYDLCVCVRPETELDLLALGARKVIRVWRSYDEVEHLSDLSSSCTVHSSDLLSCVTFVGTHIPGESRDYFLNCLVAAGVPVRIFGNGWQRSSFWKVLKPLVAGTAVHNNVYAQTLSSASACLGLLSHLNRDLHTQRSLEVTAAGGLLCAERTSEHQLLYQNGCEALFWSNASECIALCYSLLADNCWADFLRESGHRRVLELGLGNEDICKQVLRSL